MTEIEIIAKATGIYFEKSTSYLVFFSNDKHDWQSHYLFETLTIPPFNHPLHSDVLKHEVEHARFYFKFNKHRITFFLWLFVFGGFFLGAFEELWVSYKSQTINFKVKQVGFILWLILSCILLLMMIYGLLFNLNIVFGMAGGLIVNFLFNYRKYIG